MGPLNSDKISRVSSYSRTKTLFTHTGLSPFIAYLSRYFWFLSFSHWPNPRSLAATSRVSFDILSSGYWDVSVHQVCFLHLCIQYKILHKEVGCPIRKSTDQRVLAPPRGLSQPAASFIASQCQGIHHMLLDTWFFKRAEKKFAFFCTFNEIDIIIFIINFLLVTYLLFTKTIFLKKIRKLLFWWAEEDLNFRPHAYQARALTNWATGP